MTSDPGTAPHELEMASYIKRVRIALVLIGVLYAWTAYGNYDHLRPWRDGSMFETEPTGEIGRLIELAYFLIVVTGIASVASLVLAAIAGRRTAVAMYTAIGIFAVYTALRLYQTDGRYLSSGLWWATAVALGVGLQAAYKAKRQPASARVVG